MADSPAIPDSPYVVTFHPENRSFPAAITVDFSQINFDLTIGRLLDGQRPGANTLRFGSKVVSRNHCRVFMQDGKYFIQDTKSSSGTFLNGERLSPQGKDSPIYELHDGNVVKLGVDYSTTDGGPMHPAIVFRVKFTVAQVPPTAAVAPVDESQAQEDLNAGMMSDVKAAVDEEFERVWSGLIVDMQEPMRRLKSFRAAGHGATSDGGNANAQALPAIAITATTTTTAVKPPDAPSAMAKLTFHDNATIQIPMDTSLNGTFMAGTLVTAPSTLSKLTPDELESCRALIDSISWESDAIRTTVLQLIERADENAVRRYRTAASYPHAFEALMMRYVAALVV